MVAFSLSYFLDRLSIRRRYIATCRPPTSAPAFAESPGAPVRPADRPAGRRRWPEPSTVPGLGGPGYGSAAEEPADLLAQLRVRDLVDRAVHLPVDLDPGRARRRPLHDGHVVAVAGHLG